MPRRTNRLAVMTAWVVLLGGLYATVDYVKQLGALERVERSQHETAAKNAWKDGQAERDRIVAVYRTGLPKGLTRNQLFNAVPAAATARQIITERPDGVTSERLLYIDAKSYWRIELMLEGGRWTGYSISGGAPPPYTPRPITLIDSLLQSRRTILRGGMVAWFVVLVAALTFRYTRACVPILHASIAIAVAYLGIAMATPFAWSEPTDEFWLGLIIVTASVILYPAARRAAHRRRLQLIKDRICLRCGYDLRATADRCPECGTPIPTALAT